MHPRSASPEQPFLARLSEALPVWLHEPARILVAVSGGPDSVALLLGLNELRGELPLELVAAHVHHGWRGAESDADARFVADLGARLAVPTDVLRILPEHQERLAGKSLEEGARDIRYDLLTQAALQHGCRFVAVGHTSDDQVETVLHHILRGTGLSGLAGMPSERRLGDSLQLIRPLLTIGRSHVLEFLAARHQPYCSDATNFESKLTRNRLRLDLLPLLRDQFNPSVDVALLRLARQAAEAMSLLDRLAEETLQGALLEESEAACRMDVGRLGKEPEPVVRHALRRLWIRRRWPRQAMGEREWRRLARLVREPGAIDLPGGVSARRDAGPLVLRRRSEPSG